MADIEANDVGAGAAAAAAASPAASAASAAPPATANMDAKQMRKMLREMSDDMKTILNRENKERYMNEKRNRDILSNEEFKSSDDGEAYSMLYPSHDDPDFNVRVAEKKEFYDARNPLIVNDVEKEAAKICEGEFELSPHQMFIRNFLSPQTPYNSILLYHGLGTGKTCTAASACETARDYSKQIGDPRRIIIVASPNVLENFQRQLFDESKLQEVNGLWNIRACTGNKFLREINPMNTRGIPREVVVRQIRRIINESYTFLGYGKFANYIERTLDRYKDANPTKQEHLRVLALRREFSNRMIVIDEVHNIRIGKDVIGKAIAQYLLKLVMAAENVKLLLMSATPMYNSAEEIVWLINLMNANDRRSRIRVSDVFDNTGAFRTDSTGREIGREILVNKARGYISYVRGENPYSFPYRIYPMTFDPANSVLKEDFAYPVIDLVGRSIAPEKRIKVLDLFTVPIGEYQAKVYHEILRQLKDKIYGDARKSASIAQADEAGADGEGGAGDAVGGLGYSSLEPLLQCLNISLPSEELDASLEVDEEGRQGDPPKHSSMIGDEGMRRILDYTTKNTMYAYKAETLERYGRIFDPDQIGKYSAKIAHICESVKRSTGIILVFSQFISGGCIPIALALEAMGMTRYSGARGAGGGEQHLWRDPVPKESRIINGSYVLITANENISPDNDRDVRAVTADDNKNGEKIKVVIISKAGAEGIDFKNLRQVHIMEPWYNVSRQEQIIGRAIRYCSHSSLPFPQRNAQIFEYATLLADTPREESADLYIYRIAEKKAIRTGIVSRILKETAVDCLLNEEQNAITEEDLRQGKTIQLSNGMTIDYQIGDKPFTALCDFMDKCEYVCKPEASPEDRAKFGTQMETYSDAFIQLNIDSIVRNIRELFKRSNVYSKSELVRQLKLLRNYPDLQIDSALEFLISNKGEYLIDKIGRNGVLVNVADMYMFQPIELTDERLGMFERTYPVDFKHSKIRFIMPAKDGETTSDGIPLQVVRRRVAPVAVPPAPAAPAPPAAAASAAAAAASSEDGDVPDTDDVSEGAAAAAAAPPSSPEVDEPETNPAAAIFEELEEDFMRTKPIVPGERAVKADDSWYDSVRKVRDHLRDAHGISSAEVDDFVIAHQIDSLMPLDKMRVMAWLLSPDRTTELTPYQQKLLAYIDRVLVIQLPRSGAAAAAASGAGEAADDITAFMILNSAGTSVASFVYPGKGQPLRVAKTTENEKINEIIERRLERERPPNTLYGFIEIFKEAGYMIHKIRDLRVARSKGARCDQKSKSLIIKLLNDVVGREQYYTANSKIYKPLDLCVINEIILRKYDAMNKDGKHWFYMPEYYRIQASGLGK